MLKAVSSTLYFLGKYVPAEKRTQNGRSQSLQNQQKHFRRSCRFLGPSSRVPAVDGSAGQLRRRMCLPVRTCRVRNGGRIAD